MRNVLLASVAAMVFSANAANAGYLINHCSDKSADVGSLMLEPLLGQKDLHCCLALVFSRCLESSASMFHTVN
jgi:hypothetical protein